MFVFYFQAIRNNIHYKLYEQIIFTVTFSVFTPKQKLLNHYIPKRVKFIIDLTLKERLKVKCFII